MSKIQKSDIIIVLSVVAVSVLGSLFTTPNMGWYQTLSLPAFTPPGPVFGIVWTMLFALIALSAILSWRRVPQGRPRRTVFTLFVVNALLNVGWSATFSGLHLIGPAIAVAILLGLSILALIVRIWRHSTLAAVLLIPYLLWVSFAVYLNSVIWQMNT